MKKKFLTSFIAVLMALVCLFCACDCGKDESVDGDTVKNTTDLDYQPSDTDIVLASNGISEYKIVINDEDKNGDLLFASNDLQKLFKDATGATLPIIKDTGLTFDENSKYIILGANDVSNGSGMELTYSEYGADGSYIKRIGNNLLINSVFDAGAKFGVYSFLWYNLGVKIYAQDEIKMPDLKQSTVYLKDFDYKNIPDIAERVSGINERKDETTCYRLGYNKGHGQNWYAWCHTSFNLLPKSTYFETHREYYSDLGNQLCYTNEGMFEEMVKVMKERITNQEFRRTQPGFFQIGLEDNSAFCQCENCARVSSENGGNSGVLMLFMNKIADVMNPWLKETYPEMTPIKWVTFAYAGTVDPPVKQLDDGTYEPYNDAVVAHENVGIMIAPLHANWAYSITDADKNPRFKTMVEGWRVIKPEFYIYTYTQIYDNPLYYLDNWSTVKDQYQTWESLNAQYIFDEGGFDEIPFSEMRDYVHSKMFWDVNSDVEYYINDFIDNYFKETAPYVKEYLNRIRTHYKLIERQLQESGDNSFGLGSYGREYKGMVSKDYWPMDWLISGINLFDQALEVVDAMPNGDMKDLLGKRVKEERASPIYIIMDLYRFELSQSDIRYYIDEFTEAVELSGFVYNGQNKEYSNNSLMKEVISVWSTLLTD